MQVKCPQCGFEHERAADGLCPKCTNAVPAPSAPSIAVDEPLPMGSRVAGGVLILNAILTLGVIAVDRGAAIGEGGHSPIAGIFFDLWVGSKLLAGKRNAHKWAVARCVIGAVLFGGLFLARGDPASAVLQVLFSTSLAMLFAGAPGPLRLRAGAGLAGLCLFVMAMGVYAQATGTANFLRAPILRLRGEIAPVAGELRGTTGYCVQIPAGWYERSEQVTRKDNKSADRWFTRPDLDAHVMVIAESFDAGLVVDLAKLKAVSLEHAQKGMGGFAIVSDEPLPAGRLVHTRGRVSGMDIEQLRGVFADRNHAFQVLAWSTRAAFGRSEADLTAIVRSFEPRCGALSAR
jgi:hypothetical protein